MKIVLIGPQGSGKSTQGKLLAEYLKIPFISMGDIFRNIAQEASEEGKRIKQIQESGQLIDDQTTIDLIKKRLQSSDCANGFILDGFPRTLEQANSAEDLGFDKVLYFKLSQQEVLERLLKRGRVDDTEDSIKVRLVLYFQQTEPLIEYFKNKGILIEIEGVGEVDSIQTRIRQEFSQ